MKNAKNRIRAKETLLLMFTTDGLRLYEFNGKKPIMVGITLDDHDITLNLEDGDLSDAANLWRVFLELRSMCPDKHIIMPYDTNVVKIEKAGGLAEQAFDRILDPYFTSDDIDLSPKKLDLIKAEVEASTFVERETPVIPLLIAPTLSAQTIKKMKTQKSKSVMKTSDKLKGSALVASRIVHGTAHFLTDTASQLIIGSETMVEQAILGTNRTFSEAFSEVRQAREAKTRGIQQSIINKTKKLPSHLNIMHNVNTKTA